MDLNTVKSFFCTYWDNHDFYSSICYHGVSHWFPDTEPSLHLCNKSHLIMCIILSMYCWIQFVKLWFLNLCSLAIMVCNFLHLWYLCLVFVSGWRPTEWVWECFILCSFLEYFEKDIRGFPDSSVGKESACNAGDSGSGS